RPQYPSIDRQGQGAAGAGIAVAGAAAGAGDARPARFLARQLCCRPLRPARPLSAPSLAGRPGECAADPPRQAARDLTNPVNVLLIHFAKMAAFPGTAWSRYRG